MLNYLSSVATPFAIIFIIVYGLIEKNKIFDTFLEGAKEGLEIILRIFPSLIGLFLAIGALRASGLIDLIIKFISPVLKFINIPAEIMPLAFLRPISGSASMAIATDIMKTYGVDSIIGKITSTIMGSTETTLYTIATYTGVVKIKKTRGILVAALIGDIARNACVCSILGNFVEKFLLTKKGKECKIKIVKFKNYFIILLFFILFNLFFKKFNISRRQNVF